MRELIDKFDLATLFGTTPDDFNKYALEESKNYNFNLKQLLLHQRDKLFLDILKNIDDSGFSISGKERSNEWENGWKENLDEFISSGYNFIKLIPKYYKKDVPIRLNQDYFIPEDSNFVYNLMHVFRTWLFKKYFSDYSNIYEFGCGTGHHLAYLANLFPDKKIFGYDWTRTSNEIIKLLNTKCNFNINGGLFDFISPDFSIDIEPNSVVYTFGALEQIGQNHDKFVDFLLKKKPELCVNVECLYEFYDENVLSDYLAVKYHYKRKYLINYFSSLKNLEKIGKIKIIKCHRQMFGNLYHDSHSYVIWRIKKY